MAKKGTEQREETLPIVTALSIVRCPGGWQVLTLKVQGDKVISREATQADVYAIAREAFRIKAVKEFMS
jgi:hypothetical protein